MNFLGRVLFVLSIFFAAGSTTLFAQTNPPGPGVCFPPPCVPVTDHIGWLVAALVIFGVYKGIKYSRASAA